MLQLEEGKTDKLDEAEYDFEDGNEIEPTVGDEDGE